MKSWYVAVTEEGMSRQEAQDLLDLAVDAGAEAEECYYETTRRYDYEEELGDDYLFAGVDKEGATLIDNKSGYYDVKLTLQEAKDYLEGLRKPATPTTTKIPEPVTDRLEGLRLKALDLCEDLYQYDTLENGMDSTALEHACETFPELILAILQGDTDQGKLAAVNSLQEAVKTKFIENNIGEVLPDLLTFGEE